MRSARRYVGVGLTVASLLPVAAAIAAVSTVPSSAYVLPTFQVSSPKGPIRITAEELGARRTDAGLRIDEARFNQAIGRLQKMFARPASPGSYVLQRDHRVHIRPGGAGVQIDAVKMRGLLLQALRGSRSNLKLPMKDVPAPPPPSHAIVVNLQRFRLDLYRGHQVQTHFPVGVGALRFPTPPGAYYIREKAANPTWRNPGSAWARSMPAYIGPGPRNPLGTRALRLDRGALVIHGTPSPWTIGQRSSHGCIRMRRADVERLFDMVPVRTPVFIVP